MNTPDLRLLDRKDFPALLEALAAKGYRVVGPTVRDAAIVYDEIRTVADLPEGWTDEQEAGTYRLKRRDDAALFGYVVGPHSWKKYLFPPRLRLWQATRSASGFSVETDQTPPTPLAFLGARSCEIHAIAIQDKVFMGVDPVYRAQREKLFIVALNCGQAGGTCFCVSMKTGPKATSGFDLALTEILSPGRHAFVVEAGSAAGAALLKELPTAPAGDGERVEADRATERAVSQMGRRMDAGGVKELLARNLEHARWDDVASRCLACANCTLACPTCFCSTVEDTSDLTGDHAERWRSWDSCFTLQHSYLHGGSVRSTTKSRYRQWLTHKLSTWHDQFGSSGCVGCGRCITWCPVGIDLTQEVRAIRESEAGHEKP
ncbi:MAG: 4Fe-4S dicluster domain-containing protein [Planctomycetes bacterium]|nr:4Fe-4S dicluster domain-containing protein [Planctomycetota bacterium]